MLDNCTYLKETTKLRLLLHEEFYNRPEVIGQIIESIPLYFDVFSVNYVPDIMSIKIKIKKTNMKKNDSNYSHNTSYYYQIINDIFFNTFNNNMETITKILKSNTVKRQLSGNELYYLTDKNAIFGLYNVTTLLDNLIVINL